MGHYSYTEEAINEITRNQNLLAHCGRHANSTAKHIVRWLRGASRYRLSNLNFTDLVTNHDVSSLSHEDIADIPLGSYAVEIDFSPTVIPGLLPGGYTPPGQELPQASSRRISLVVRLNYNRLFEFLSGAGPLAENGISKNDYKMGGIVIVPIAFIDSLKAWVAAYGCAVISSTPLTPETPEGLYKRHIREARYIEHCTETDSSRQSPLPYNLLVTMPEILPEIPNPDHIDEMLLADCNDELVIGSHFIHALKNKHLYNEKTEKIFGHEVKHVKIVF